MACWCPSRQEWRYCRIGHAGPAGNSGVFPGLVGGGARGARNPGFGKRTRASTLFWAAVPSPPATALDAREQDFEGEGDSALERLTHGGVAQLDGRAVKGDVVESGGNRDGIDAFNRHDLELIGPAAERLPTDSDRESGRQPKPGGHPDAQVRSRGPANLGRVVAWGEQPARIRGEERSLDRTAPTRLQHPEDRESTRKQDVAHRANGEAVRAPGWVRRRDDSKRVGLAGPDSRGPDCRESHLHAVHRGAVYIQPRFEDSHGRVDLDVAQPEHGLGSLERKPPGGPGGVHDQ